MKRSHRITSFCPKVKPLQVGIFEGLTLRHTIRKQGTQDWLLLYTFAGSGLYRFPEGAYHSQAHDLTLYSPGAFHEYLCAPEAAKWDVFYAHFLPRPEWLPLLHWPELSPGLRKLSIPGSALNRRIGARLREIVHLLDGSLLRREQWGINALEEVFLWCDSVNPQPNRAELDPRVRKAMEYLVSHLAEPFSESGLAQYAGLSASRMRHIFHAEMKCSPREFLEQERMRRARDYLSLSRLSVGEISEKLGFENPFYFSTRFRKLTGESPRAYRDRTINP